ncbi:MAG: glucose-6-phosphate isomerase [Caldisericum exile]|uniref:Glucose-6-phosphate isomerase n=1 Tax=Caldisericum exile TaxID=693075 RepID=A0A2J6X655_9BACT|nr:MAG: glucose-6-phosphate isomerase [Caldisericum exile]
MKIDFTNIFSENIGEHGVNRNEIFKKVELIKSVKKRIIDKINDDFYPLTLPDEMLKEVYEINNYASYIREKFDNLVVIGMGGSILGNELLHYSVNGIYSNFVKPKKVYFIDNIDPETNLTLIQTLDLKKTFFNIITKSGSTSETLLNLLLLVDILKKEGLNPKEHFLFTTDPEKGLLRKLSNELEIKTYPIHPKVGGRYSVLSHVGLFSAVFEEINIEKLLLGAKERKEKFLNKEPIENSEMLFALTQYKFFKEKDVNINVIFSYSDGLEYLGKFYEQLLAESIGKKFSRDGKEIYAGITPVVARGPYHQHSTLQLFMEGPYDKLIIFVVPKKFRKDALIYNSLGYLELDFLTGKHYSELLLNEYIATKMALTQNGRPNVSIEIEKIDEENLGRLIYFMELEVLALGELLNINPIDQPSVEIGKRFTHALMGDKNYSEYLKTLEKLENVDKLILD